MQITVESVTLSKSGNSYQVKAGGQLYTCKAKGIEQATGKVIDVVLGSFVYNNKTFPTIESFEYIAAPSTAFPGPASVAAASTDRYWLSFVSNQVAHAIAAGLIKEPGDMDKWAKAAYAAVNNADDVSF